jgi:hypothetical protein
MEKDSPRQRFPTGKQALVVFFGGPRVWTVVSLVAPEVALQKYYSPGPWKGGWALLQGRSRGKKLTGPSGRHRVGVSTLLNGGKICYLPRSAAISNDMV